MGGEGERTILYSSGKVKRATNRALKPRKSSSKKRRPMVCCAPDMVFDLPFCSQKRPASTPA